MIATIEVSTLPTPVALVARRLNTTGVEASGDSFLMTSYLAEVAIKLIAISLTVGLRTRAPTHAYRLEHGLIRADGLGTWEAAIREITSEPLAGFLPPHFASALRWATKKRTKPEDDWFRTAKGHADRVLDELGAEMDLGNRPSTIRDLIVALVQIRNKTKAHGAVGPDFFASINQPYARVVSAFVMNCPVFEWDWMYLARRDRGNVRGIWLRGDPKHMKEADANNFNPMKPGVYFRVEGSAAYYVGDLVYSNRECTKFSLPNGGYTGKGQAEFLDYAAGVATRVDAGDFAAPPVLPPSSETEGLATLTVQGNIFANLPPVPQYYVERPVLQQELDARLRDRNHAIITLHGRGGVGKTSLALFAAHRLTAEPSPRFDSILWFSARDVDLRPGGPSFVRPDVVELQDIGKRMGTLLDTEDTASRVAEILQDASAYGRNGILFIFDNFETMAGMVELQRFLDTHTHLPNKVLITSRERVFKADYPIEVRGMELGEAMAMMRAQGRLLSVEGLLTEEVLRSIFDRTEGHAYLMRVVIGEMAKEGRYVPPKELVSRRIDIVDAVFERSFDKLSEAGKIVFLTISNWKSAIPAVALVVVIGQGEVDVESGIDECIKLSLIGREYLADGQPCYVAPVLARLFGEKKLQGDPDRLLIQGYLDTIRRFGVLDPTRLTKKGQEELTARFIAWCIEEAKQDPVAANLARVDSLLQALAELWPPAWLDLARFRRDAGGEPSVVGAAFRRAVEEMPDSVDAWLERGSYAESVDDRTTSVTSYISAADAAPSDIELLERAAGVVTRHVIDKTYPIPPLRRGLYLASIRGHMERVADQLSPDGLSKLAWLFLLENRSDEAIQYAKKGLNKDPNNEYCLNVLQRIEHPELFRLR